MARGRFSLRRGGREASAETEAEQPRPDDIATARDAGPVAEPDLAPPDWVMDVRDAGTPAPASEPQPAIEPPGEGRESAQAAPRSAPEGMISLGEASFEELRELGMSITQAKRVIRHREEHGGFRSVDELDGIPGFPKAYLARIKDRLVP